MVGAERAGMTKDGLTRSDGPTGRGVGMAMFLPQCGMQRRVYTLWSTVTNVVLFGPPA